MNKIYFIKELIKPIVSLYDYTYTPDAFTITYDGQDHTPTFVVKNPDGTTLTENVPDEYGVIYYINNNVEDWTNAGTKRVTITFKGTDTDNFIYTNDWLRTIGDTRVSGWSAIIEPRELTVEAIDTSKIQREADPPLTLKATGNMEGETPGYTGAVTRNPGEASGTYDITIGSLQLADNITDSVIPFLASNYTMNFIKGIFTIMPAPTHDGGDGLINPTP